MTRFIESEPLDDPPPHDDEHPLYIDQLALVNWIYGEWVKVRQGAPCVTTLSQTHEKLEEIINLVRRMPKP